MYRIFGGKVSCLARFASNIDPSSAAGGASGGLGASFGALGGVGNGVVTSFKRSSMNRVSVTRRLRTFGSEERLMRQVKAFLVFAYSREVFED